MLIDIFMKIILSKYECNKKIDYIAFRFNRHILGIDINLYPERKILSKMQINLVDKERMLE